MIWKNLSKQKHWRSVCIDFTFNMTQIEIKYILQRELECLLCNNQINARALIGQLAMVYCASKHMEKSRGFWIII